MADASRVEDLVRRCVDGDAEAQAELCADYAPLVKSAVLRQLTRLNANAGEFAQADDLVQEVLERLLVDDCRLMRKLHKPQSIHAWLVTLARRHVIDRLKRDATRSRYETAYVAEDPAPNEASPETAQAAADQNESMRAALRELSDQDRIVLELYYVEGLRYAEMADMLGLNINTCSARLRRAKGRLRKLIEESGDAFGS